MNCENCGKEILDALRVTKRFCSDKCRIIHHYSKDKTGLNPNYSQLNTENKIIVNDKDSVKRQTVDLDEVLGFLNWQYKEDPTKLNGLGVLDTAFMGVDYKFFFDDEKKEFYGHMEKL